MLSYRVPFLRPECFGGLADSSVSCTDEYGRAEFQAGMGEVSEEPSDSFPSAITTHLADASVTDDVSAQTFSVLQKALFLLVILGCVAGYMRMGNRKKGRYSEKSLA